MTEQTGPAGWYPDPTGRHDHRYFDGAVWTEDVADGGAAGTDPVGVGAPGGESVAAPPADPQSGDEPTEAITVSGAASAGRPSGGADAGVELGRGDVKAAARSGDIATLVAALGAESRKVRRAAAKALADEGGDEAVEGLLDAAFTISDIEVQETAADGLKRLGDPRATAALTRSLVLKGLLDEQRLMDQVARHPEVAARMGITAADRGDATGGSSHTDVGLITRLPVDGLAAPAKGSEPEPVTVVGDGRCRPGESITVLVRPKKWPDPRLEGVEITVGYRKSRLMIHGPGGSHHTAVGILTEHTPYSTDQKETYLELDRRSFEASELDDEGRLAAEVRIPRHAPASVTGLVSWGVSARFRRHHREDPTVWGSFNVAGPTAEELSRIVADLDRRDDWLSRACEVGNRPWEERVAASDRRSVVTVDLADSVGVPGRPVAGTATLAPETGDDVRLLPRAARRHQPDGRARLDTIWVGLECWRGSSAEQACHRMLLVETQLHGPFDVVAGEVIEVPFEIVVPSSGRFSWSAARGAGTDVALVGTHLPSATQAAFDDVRWRMVVTATGPLRSGPEPESPWWGARELVVASG